MLTIVLGFPAAAFIANSSYLVGNVFGEQWKGAAAVTAVMAVVGFVRAVGYVPGALMSVSVHNRQLLTISFISVAAGDGFRRGGGSLGVLWCAVALLVRHLGSLGWMAATLRSEATHTVRTYTTGLAVPFLLMLAGTLAGRWLIGDAATGQGIARQFLLLAGSIAAGTAVGAGYFIYYLRRRLSRYYVILRGRLVASA